MNICVYGAASNKIDKVYVEKTEQLGKQMARQSIGLVFGAGANGLMGACARGVYSENGKIIGIVPRFFTGDGIRFEKCTETIFTDTMRERKKLMEEMSSAFIITPGGIGTLDEFFEIFTLQNLNQHQKAVAIYNICGFYDTMLQMLNELVEKGFLAQSAVDRLIVSDDPEDLLERIKEFQYK
ncbi:MAG: TIGR00730 family Rossman fold protein [Ruminococcaceae bacterium]|nr:TIGR00730 family Rossman fold protein [Oscillospiraceae bacterium]